jgi:hypothetical protein
MQTIVLAVTLFDALDGTRGGASRDCRVEDRFDIAEAGFEGLAGFTDFVVVAGGLCSSSSLMGALLTRPGYAMQRIRANCQKTRFFRGWLT